MAKDAKGPPDQEPGNAHLGTRQIPSVRRGAWQHESLDANKSSKASAPELGVHLSPKGVFEHGRVLAGRYKILGTVGAGGMGTVYKAQDLELDVFVALKVIRREIARAPKVLERFRNEVKLARRVTHKNVARIHDIGEVDGVRFLTMELVEGQCLEDLMAVHPMPLPNVLRIALPLCEGLAAAHDVGVVHRDLKPGNIMIGEDGRVVITDFGIARAIEPEASSQTGGMVLGTPAYMAPEQLKGSAEVDARADIFALGVLLFELCVGRRPFEDVPALSRHLEPPPNPEGFGVPAEVAKAIIRCLELQPAARFSSAREVADALRSVRQDGSRSFVVERLPLATRQLPVRLVAVLAIRNHGSPDDDYLAAGLTDALVGLLSKAPGLTVRPRGAVARPEHTQRTVQMLGRELGVEAVVEGSIRRTLKGLSVALRATDVLEGMLWTEGFDIAPSSLGAITEDLATAIAQALTGEPISFPRPIESDAGALDLQMRAQHEYHAFERISSSSSLPALRATVLKSAELFDRAHELAPDDPAILSGCVLAHARTWFLGDARPRAHGFVSAARAIELAPARGAPYLCRAVLQFQAGNLDAAVQDARYALSLTPQLAGAHELLGRLLCETGPIEEGIHHIRSAAELEPRLLSSRATLLRACELAGEHLEADRLIDEIAATDDSGVGWTMLARVVMWRTDVARARALFEHPVVQSGNAPSAREILRFVLEPERVPSAGKLMMSMLGAVGASWRVPIFLNQVRTELNVSMGKLDQARASLATSVEAGLADLTWLDGCSLLRELRGDHRFLALRATARARAAAVNASKSGGEAI